MSYTLTRVSVGEVGVRPGSVKMTSTANLATITAAGYLNGTGNQLPEVNLSPSDIIECLYSFNETTGTGTYSLFQPSISAGVITLVGISEGDIVLPTVADHIVYATNTSGEISTANGVNVINGGNIQAGLSGTAGTLASYPATALKGALLVAGVANTGNTNVTISNAAHGQASVYSIPDGGQATAEFVISDSAGTQHITSGGLQVDAGAVSSGLAAGGFVGRFDAYSTTAANGKLSMVAANAGADFDTTISNATSVGQDQVISIPDSGQATSEFIIADSAGTQSITSGSLTLTLGNLSTAAGTIQADAASLISGLAAGGFVGNVTAYPTTTASGSLNLTAADNASGDFSTTISNHTAVGQSQVLAIPDVGAATGSFMLSSLAAADVGANLVSFDVTVGQAALATGGSVVLVDSSGTKQYKIRSLWLNSGGTNFAGGGGDRLGQVTDGTTVYSVVPAATMQSLVNSGWGDSTPLPYPAAAAINTSSAAGADIVFSYSGGATDYTAGSLVISGIAERVA